MTPPGWRRRRTGHVVAQSAHRVIDGATHAGLLDDEEAAAATTQAILDVVSSTRNGELLAR